MILETKQLGICSCFHNVKAAWFKDGRIIIYLLSHKQLLNGLVIKHLLGISEGAMKNVFYLTPKVNYGRPINYNTLAKSSREILLKPTQPKLNVMIFFAKVIGRKATEYTKRVSQCSCKHYHHKENQ